MNQAETSTSHRSRRRIWLVVAVVIAIAIAAIPWVLAKTPLRDRLLNRIVASDEISVSTTDASLGYVAALSVSGLQIKSRDQRSRIEIEHIQADHSWLGLLLSRPELGTFRFQKPYVDVTIDPAALGDRAAVAKVSSSNSNTADLKLPNFAASIENAAVVVRTPGSAKPPIDLEELNVTLRVQNSTGRSVLQLEPSTVFDHQRITPELCGQGLQLIAPLLADQVSAEGAFSLRLKQFQIPLSGEQESRRQEIQIEGELQLHEANVGLRNTIAKGITDAIMNLIGVSAPERLTVAKDLVVQFQVVDGRVRHEGLALLLPHGDSSIVFTSTGSVGLDETLELEVAVKFPDHMLGGGPLVQRLTKTPIVLAITGTMKQPKVSLANTDGLVGSIRELVQGDADPNSPGGKIPSPEALPEAVDAVGDLLGGIRDRVENRRESGENRRESGDRGSLRPNLRNLIRDRPRLRSNPPGDVAPTAPTSGTQPATGDTAPKPSIAPNVPAPPAPQVPGEPEPIDI